MNLYCVNVMDDSEEYFKMVVANSTEEAEKKAELMDCWDCFMFCKAYKVDDVIDGYSIIVKKISDILDNINKRTTENKRRMQ